MFKTAEQVVAQRGLPIGPSTYRRGSTAYVIKKRQVKTVIIYYRSNGSEDVTQQEISLAAGRIWDGHYSWTLRTCTASTQQFHSWIDAQQKYRHVCTKTRDNPNIWQYQQIHKVRLKLHNGIPLHWKGLTQQRAKRKPPGKCWSKKPDTKAVIKVRLMITLGRGGRGSSGVLQCSTSWQGWCDLSQIPQ